MFWDGDVFQIYVLLYIPKLIPRATKDFLQKQISTKIPQLLLIVFFVL